MTLTVRPIRPDELTAFVDALSRAFLERPDVARAADACRAPRLPR